MTHWDEEPENDLIEDSDADEWDELFETSQDSPKDPKARGRLREARSLERLRRPLGRDFRHDE